jgi:hypothetical protein
MKQWMNKLQKFLLSGSGTKLDEAFALKSQYVPINLYKYRALDPNNDILFKRLVDIVNNDQLYFTLPTNLNDPLECHSVLSTINHHMYNFKSGDFLRNIQQTDNQEERNINLINEIILKNDSFNKTIALIPLTCFTEKFDDLLMWSHYSNAHKGVCLEFNTTKLIDAQFNCIFPVIYKRKMPDFVKLDASKDPKFPVNVSLYLYFCLIKLMPWKYESEWRYLAIDHAGTIDNGTNIDFIKPSKIILGSKISKEHQILLFEIAKKNDINISKMSICNTGLQEIGIN